MTTFNCFVHVGTTYFYETTGNPMGEFAVYFDAPSNGGKERGHRWNEYFPTRQDAIDYAVQHNIVTRGELLRSYITGEKWIS